MDISHLNFFLYTMVKGFMIIAFNATNILSSGGIIHLNNILKFVSIDEVLI